MGISEGLTKYYGCLGLRGVLAVTAYRLFGWPKEVTVRPPGIRNPIYLRIRTSDADIYTAVLLNGEYAFDLPFCPSVIVDVGANIGMTSIFFTHRYPEAKIIAIEPEASNFAALARNVRPYPAIVPVHAALWKSDGEISISEPDPSTGASGNWGFVVHEGEGDVNVRAMTMRTLMREMGLHFVDLLKIDIEGGEKEVFEAYDWIDDVRCLMIELHDWCRPGCSDAVDPAMLGFSKIRRGETTLYVREDRIRDRA